MINLVNEFEQSATQLINEDGYWIKCNDNTDKVIKLAKLGVAALEAINVERGRRFTTTICKVLPEQINYDNCAGCSFQDFCKLRKEM